ncbi:Hypothetical protein FKW44_017414 [Caligus rogercresseyi]|uniref:Uncharacterized protein n=1 Tax=Caligus rogercresseyi TaxID=217165 RepID=A0A7T8GTC4_CALRO|nr:Hypothetical protein FKW44_017414 [Caligus rogercresseyi]
MVVRIVLMAGVADRDIFQEVIAIPEIDKRIYRGSSAIGNKGDCTERGHRSTRHSGEIII